MAVLPIKPTPFFDNKNRAFWNLQFIGWGGAFILRSASALSGGQELSFLVVTLIEMITGFSISLVLSVIYRQLLHRRPLIAWGLSGVALAFAVLLFAFINSWVITLYRPGAEGAFGPLLIGIFFFDLTLLGAWSALYYAINFYLQIEQQADRMLRLEAQAASAQLDMLRYQLNPHFLFNTLNSISTLVLLKQTEPANAMLTRLSSFLRHTLITQPSGKVTLDQEIETLKLYLDIERMRFEERLRTSFRVQHEAAVACLPSLLLQPLVENAIKYAVSPQEEGAKISLVAQRMGDRLRIAVSDTGPGLRREQDWATARGAPARGGARPVSTGVGLANIRNRLAQAYGEDHRFEIRTPIDGGFMVVIEIPYEVDETEAAKLAAAKRRGETAKPSLATSVVSEFATPKTGS
ncbi:sensor histidine kinase [Altererythrobacter aurantiacus]|uniref:Sensor histidine kinase n=1 Tax=Parapontixanthobacter aurantiacus TaxID=1463599 RepID=A0A844ZH83_9SPHN|nr:histidine kinase [Parapontixanthobacter aurantiacus]MXO86914.1 sensor histidine kinase [Parapontixanthobacter aurantiacus]